MFILFQFVIVAVNAAPDDAVVPSAVLINKDVDTALPQVIKHLLCTDVKSVHQVVADESANQTWQYLQADGMLDGILSQNSSSALFISSHLKFTFAVHGLPLNKLYTYQSDVKSNVIISSVCFAAKLYAADAVAFINVVDVSLNQFIIHCLS